MSKLRFSPTIFMIAFCAAYITVLAKDWPLFRYYPLHGTLSWGIRMLDGAGPPITWYGLMTDAAITASLAAVIVQDRVINRALQNYLWCFPCAALLTCVFLLRRWFG